MRKFFDIDSFSHTDANGNTTTMSYDNSGRLLSTLYPDGTSENYSYDVANGITTYIAPNGTVYKAYYDAWTNPVKRTFVNNGTEIILDSYEYDDRENVATYKKYIDDTNFVQVEYTYDYLDRPLTEKIYNNGITLVRTTTFEYTAFADENEYPSNMVTITVSGDNGTYAKTSRTANYRGFVVEDKAFTETDCRAKVYTHDYVGNVITSTDALGNVTTTEYTGLNNPSKVTYPDGTSVSTQYNMAGLASAFTDALGNTAKYFYDTAGRLVRTTSPIDLHIDAENKTYYDGNGNVVSQRVLSCLANENKQYTRTDTTYDSMNRPVFVTVYPTDETHIVSKYSYDTMGNVTESTNGLPDESSPLSSGQTTRYEYDALGRLIEQTYPDGKVQTTQYDLAGRLISSVDKNGTISTFAYDVFDNLVSVCKGEESIMYAYDLMGNRTSMTDSTGTTCYAYSPYGELTNEQKSNIIKSYSYDALGRKVAMSVMDGSNVLSNQTYTYDNMSRLTSTHNGLDTVQYTYDANSNVLTETINGTLIKNTAYNKANLPEVIRTYLPNTTETTVRTYSSDGNLRMEHKDNKDTFYYYDGANRLIYEGVWGDDASYEDFYTYDRFGNRVNKEHTDLVTSETQSTDYVYNILNQLTEQTDGTDTLTYTYDDNGNMLNASVNNQTTKEYTYDVFNRLATANVNGNTAHYTYNGDNLRQSKSVNGVTTEHIYDGQNIIADVSQNTNTYIYGLGIVGMRTNGGTLQIYATTPRGDVAKLINHDGTYQEYEYDAYGNPTGDNTYTVNPFGYTGQYTDYETGLVYLRNRYYDTELGVFLTEDPIKDGSNWYVYCSGNPVMFVDPCGLVVTEWDKRFLSEDDLKQIEENDKLWNTGNEQQKQLAAESSKQIRKQYLQKNQTLLDNGYVLEINEQNITRSILYDEVVAITSVSFQRFYKEDGIYVRVKNVNVHIQTATPRTFVDEVRVYIGQSSKNSQTQTHTEKTHFNNFEYSPDWDWVMDYGEEWLTTVGAVIDISIQRGSAKHTLTINNQLYSTSYFVNGEIQREMFSAFDVLRDVFQRPEREFKSR